jgi:hypothetical protein
MSNGLAGDISIQALPSDYETIYCSVQRELDAIQQRQSIVFAPRPPSRSAYPDSMPDWVVLSTSSGRGNNPSKFIMNGETAFARKEEWTLDLLQGLYKPMKSLFPCIPKDCIVIFIGTFIL